MPGLLVRFKAVERDLKLLWFALFCAMLGWGAFSASYYNFITEVVKIQPGQLGMVEAVRELPGLLCVVGAAITMRLAEPLAGSLGLFLMAIGIGAFAWVRHLPGLFVCNLIMTTGLHAWMPLQSSITMDLARDGEKGKRLGQTACVVGMGSVCGMLLVRFIGHTLTYPKWFILSFAWILAGSILLLALRRDIGHAEKPRFVWKRKYRLYYLLNLLEGGRRQVFMTFAIYALTREYHTPMQTVALLMVINQVANMIGGPIVGRMIDRIGERKILLATYSALIFVFLGYGLIRHLHVLYVMYCLDNLLFLSTNCLPTYLQKIAEPEDLMPTLSLGVSCGHMAAVVVPLVGGFMWASMGFSAVFVGGAGLVVISLFLAARVPAHTLKSCKVAS
ncbi:MAG: MFS transporter [Armatimonadetes bacterium]|nr:MFS transporter [Armatimonadota bacterium]